MHLINSCKDSCTYSCTLCSMDTTLRAAHLARSCSTVTTLIMTETMMRQRNKKIPDECRAVGPSSEAAVGLKGAHKICKAHHRFSRPSPAGVSPSSAGSWILAHNDHVRFHCIGFEQRLKGRHASAAMMHTRVTSGATSLSVQRCLHRWLMGPGSGTATFGDKPVRVSCFIDTRVRQRI